MFRWFEQAMGISEDEFRRKIYMAAVARCFPGKSTSGGGDRVPDRAEIAACGRFLKRETEILQPDLIIPVGRLAIEQVLERKLGLVEVIGKAFDAEFYGVKADVVALPHPSGASPWPRIEPGRSLLAKALQLIADHPAMHKAFPSLRT